MFPGPGFIPDRWFQLIIKGCLDSAVRTQDRCKQGSQDKEKHYEESGNGGFVPPELFDLIDKGMAIFGILYRSIIGHRI